MQCPQNGDRSNGGAGEIGRDIWRDSRQAENVDVQRFAYVPSRFEIRARVISQTEVQPLPSRGLLHHVRMPIELVANGGPDEIGPVRIEPVPYHQVDVT